MNSPDRYRRSPSLVARYEKVFRVLFKYGFEDLLAHPPFNRFLPTTGRWTLRRNGRLITDFTRYQRIRMVCAELGTTFIKFAQIASNRPDLLPEELITELTSLQDRAPVVGPDAIRQAVIEELGKPPKELFEDFNYEPIASASMAQVHRARLRGGKDVVLKIQRPGIARTIDEDIAILKQLAQIIEMYFPQYDAFQPVELVKMFETTIRKELRFSLEALNLRRFQENFRGNPDIYLPDYYPEYSTDRIICLEFIEGVKITDLEALSRIGLTGPELARKGIGLYFEQVFDHGFFHADPHPGNIFVMPNRRVCFIDYGMMGSVAENDKELLGDLLLAIHEQNVDALKKALLRFCTDPQSVNVKNLEYDILIFFQEYTNMTIDEIEGEAIIETLNALFFNYHIKVPPNLLLLLKALVIIEGVGLTLDPQYNIIENIAPYVRRLLARKYAPYKLAQYTYKAVGDFSKMAFNLPEDIDVILRKLRDGKLHIEFEHKGLDTLYQKMEIVSNRIAFALLVMALILGSSIIVIAQVPPLIGSIPLLGVVGFVLSGLLALRLIFSIIRHGNF